MDIGNRTLSMADLQKNTLVSGNKAMQMLELSRHSFEKVVKDGLLTIIYENGKKYYQIGEIEAFMSTDTYTELVNGVVDPRNILNDLTGKDWLPEVIFFMVSRIPFIVLPAVGPQVPFSIIPTVRFWNALDCK